MIVMKFGGTSVGDAKMMNKTLDIVQSKIQQGPLVVSSAMTKVTDALIHLSLLAESGNLEALKLEIAALKTRHLDTARALLSSYRLDNCLALLEGLFKDLEGLGKGLCMIREVSPRSKDALLSYGERLSTSLLYYLALERDLPCTLLDAREFIKTDDNFNQAEVNFEQTFQLCKEKISCEAGKICITQGFIASSAHNISTTLGRGGSDYSATIIGAALKAEAVEIWTDVDGILSTDPRILPEASVIPEISYEEAAELAYFGAKVIHPSTIQPAVELGIPVWVKNTMNPEAKGTCIKPASLLQTSDNTRGPIALACKKNITILTVHSSRMLNAFGFLKAIFAVFEKHRVSVDLVATSEVSVSVTLDDEKHLKAVQKDLSTFADVALENRKAILCLVGRKLYQDKSLLSRVFSALDGIPVRLITMGASEINLSLVCDQEHLESAIYRLHSLIHQAS